MQTTTTIWGGGETRKDINSVSVVEEERWSQLEGRGGGDEVRRPIDVLYIVMNVGTVGRGGWGGVKGRKCKWRKEDKSRPRLTISIAVNLAARRKTGNCMGSSAPQGRRLYRLTPPQEPEVIRRRGPRL